MKSTSRLLAFCVIVLIIIMILNAFPYVERAWNTIAPVKTVQQIPASITPIVTRPATITVNSQAWGKSTCFIGATEGSSRFDINDLIDLGINSYHIYGGMSRWEPQNDSKVYGTPTIEQIKANPDTINWQQWDTIMTQPPDDSDYAWETPPRWQGNARTLFSSLKASHMRVILVLRNRDDQGKPDWSPDPPRTAADWNEWWEHVFATVYWFNVRNSYDVTDFEILNEPNIPLQGWSPQASEQEYFTLAQYTSDAINYVFHRYLPAKPYHIYAPATSGGVWPKDALQSIPQSFDSMDIHNYGNFRETVQETHTWMNQAGYGTEPLWVTEWGSYQGQYDSEPFGITLINKLIYGAFPGNDYVYGSLLFALYDFSKNPTGLIDYHGHRRTDYYAVRMAIRALQGCRSTYQSIVGDKSLLAITTTDENRDTYFLVTNQSSNVAYTAQVDLSALLQHASGIMWRFDSRHLDTVAGKLSIKNGNISLIIPANGAVLVKLSSTV